MSDSKVSKSAENYPSSPKIKITPLSGKESIDIGFFFSCQKESSSTQISRPTKLEDMVIRDKKLFYPVQKSPPNFLIIKESIGEGLKRLKSFQFFKRDEIFRQMILDEIGKYSTVLTKVEYEKDIRCRFMTEDANFYYLLVNIFSLGRGFIFAVEKVSPERDSTLPLRCISYQLPKDIFSPRVSWHFEDFRLMQDGRIGIICSFYDGRTCKSTNIIRYITMKRTGLGFSYEMEMEKKEFVLQEENSIWLDEDKILTFKGDGHMCCIAFTMHVEEINYEKQTTSVLFSSKELGMYYDFPDVFKDDSDFFGSQIFIPLGKTNLSKFQKNGFFPSQFYSLI